MNHITFKSIHQLPIPAVADLLFQAGILQPAWTEERLARAFENSPVVITAWDGEVLIGVTRTITDFAWCAYLSQLAVLPGYQRRGIGQELIKRTKEKLGDEVALLIHSVQAPSFYKKMGFVEYQDCYRLPLQF